MTNLQEQQTVKRIKDKFVTINDFNDKEVRLWINELIKNDIVKVSNHKNYLEISDVEYNRFFNIEIFKKGRLVIDYKKQKLINVIKRNNIDSDKYPNANYIIKFASNTTTRHYVKLDEDKDIESQVRNFLDVVMPEHYKNKEYIFMYKDSE